MSISRALGSSLCGSVIAIALISPAAAADLGGDCCADLEERVAELEATTARKGNRKVSLTISGWVNENVIVWDDGTERNAYVGTNSVEQSRFRFVGEAKISADWSAGYTLEIGTQGHPSNQWNQNSPSSSSSNPNNQDNQLLVRKSYWFIKNKDWGQVAVGQNGTATYHLLDDADFTLTRNVDDAEGAAIYLSQFQLRANGQPLGTNRWTDILRGFNNSTPGDSARRNVVRYDSPTFAGFSGAAAWGEDDIWDVALTYKNDIGDFSVLARAGYGQSNDPGTQFTGTPSTYVAGGTPCISSSTTTASSLPPPNQASHQGFECDWGGAAATIMHKPTGLFVFGGWGKQHIETGNPGTNALLVEPDSTVWFIQPGIEQKWFSLGKTNIFAEYRHDDAGSNPGRTVSSSVNFWQGGIIQYIDAAELSLYAVYEHADGDVIGSAGTVSNGIHSGKTSLDAFQAGIFGAKINF
ncbi:porin [Hyphomicrobium sp. 99]|uniref:porin n=1 Tax=Hyphomicrobium sp. 99 TaxID=1163419 RepID=UPI0005F81373|nr:porin [Hyphomicrobium sp. 99]